MKSWFIVQGNPSPIDSADDSEIRFQKELPQKFITEYTQPGDAVLDVFAGFGTTLFAAQELGRIGVGIEYEQARVDFIEKQLKAPSRILCGDSRKLASYDLPQFDLCFTSPPYMRSFDPENPLTNYREPGTYDDYLKQMGDIFRQVKSLMKPAAKVIVEVENTHEEGKPVTPLAWDLAKLLSEIFFFEQDFVCCADREGTFKTDHSYVLVFKA